LHIDSPTLVSKVERLAQATGLTQTAVLEKAVDLFLAELEGAISMERMRSLLAKLDQIPVQNDVFDPLAWDEIGLPK